MPETDKEGFWAWWEPKPRGCKAMWLWSGSCKEPQGKQHLVFLGENLKTAQENMDKILENHKAIEEVMNG